MPAAAIIINRLRVRDAPGFRRRCREAAQARGLTAEFFETTRNDEGLVLAQQAVAAGAALVVAAGGDGTVRSCVQALADRPAPMNPGPASTGPANTGPANTGPANTVPLAIVPLGTANLAARALGLPRRLDALLAVAFGGQQRLIDLAEADGMPYAAMAGIGLDATVVGATPRLLKERFGWLGYAAAGTVRLPGRRHEFTVRLDGGPPLTRRARSVAVGNAGLLPGGFVLLPDARLDDGVLDVGILAPAGPLGWGRVAYRVITGSRRDDRRLERYRARRVDIQADADLPREVDGEVIAPGRTLTIEIRPAALLVRAPRS
ncbi:MAG TPA: diacylglycerol kinase family protein [Streptosporangiaceae bacterium]